MDYLTERKYTFTSAAVAPDTFGVVDFQGLEQLSGPYEFNLLLVSGQAELDPVRLLESRATLGLHRMDGRVAAYHGVITRLEQLHAVDGHAFYRARLVPRLGWLGLNRHCQVFLDKTVPEIIQSCLEEGGLTARDYEFRLRRRYPVMDYVCQFQESHLDFISRWLEREGIYYFFEQGPDGEKVILTDSKTGHADHPQGEPLLYRPPSSLEAFETETVARSFNCRCQLLPAGVRTRDYNPDKPSLGVEGAAVADARGRGEVYCYGGRLATVEEAQRLAEIQAETFSCRREVFEGESAAPFLAPGYTVALRDHYRGSFNRTYLVTEVHHEGSQAGFLQAGLKQGLRESAEQVFYRNRFQAIPATTQYRPARKAAWPKVAGTLPAHVDAAGSGQYAELDERGRYKVTLPFDLSGRRDGKASTWLRLATPYAGPDHGLHFPLHKGTEVLLTFEDGDPDRPVIAAAVPNPDTPSPVTGANQTAAVIRTGSGNRIQFEDQAGRERILLHTPAQPSFIRIGAHNDPPAATPPTTTPTEEPWKFSTDWGIAKKTDGWIDLEAKISNVIILGESFTLITLLRTWLTGGIMIDATVGLKWELHFPQVLKFKNRHWEINEENWQQYARVMNFFASRREFAGMQTDITNRVTAAVDQRVQRVGNEIRAHQDYITASGSSLRCEQAKLATQVEKRHAAGVMMDNTASKFEKIGNGLKQGGSMVRMAGVDVMADGEHMVRAGNKFATGATELKTGARIMQE